MVSEVKEGQGEGVEKGRGRCEWEVNQSELTSVLPLSRLAGLARHRSCADLYKLRLSRDNL